MKKKNIQGFKKDFHKDFSKSLLKIIIKEIFQSHAPSFLLKCLISLSTIILLGLIIAYHAREIQVRRAASDRTWIFGLIFGSKGQNQSEFGMMDSVVYD